MLSLAPCLESFLKSLPPRPFDQQRLDDLVDKTLKDSASTSSADNRKSSWEYLLKDDIFTLAATEGKALGDEETTYYDELRDKLDLILTFTEHDACEPTFPFSVLQDLLETQTIASCSHIFSWIEERAQRLTQGMVPQKGKALVLLRTLNDLLRRLSKMGNTTMFCGRILTLLSGVFPLGERSGVNLRGEYGPTWEGLGVGDNAEEKAEEAVGTDRDVDAKVSGENTMEVDVVNAKKLSPTAKVPSKKEEFYNTFWSLQLPFSKPPLFANPTAFPEFKEAVNKVLPSIKEATAKERAMMGSSRSGIGSLKRKREPETGDDTTASEYFFAKFLTSPELLDLEIADTHFRRQFVFQLLILLHHLLTFTKSSKASWSTSRNRSLQMDYTLSDPDALWIQETITKCMDELKQTTPGGRAFADTVAVILEREKNWVRWKNELCTPFDKEPWEHVLDSEDGKGRRVGLEEATREKRAKMREDPENWPWKLGTEPLTEIWEMGYRGLDDLRNLPHPGDVKDYVKKVKQEDVRIDMRKKTLAKTAERLALARARASKAASPAPSPALPLKAESTSPERPSTPARASTPARFAAQTVNSPLHPSLPAKPGSSPQRPPTLSSQEGAKAATPALLPAPTPIPASVPAIVTPAPAPYPPTSTPPDDQITKFEDNKHRWAWLCLRIARDLHLQHFGKIGTGDIVQLSWEIEKEAKEKEKAPKEELNTSSGERGASPLVVAAVPMKGSDEDVKMGGEDAKSSDGTNDDAKMAPITRIEEGKVVDEGDVKMESDIKL